MTFAVPRSIPIFMTAVTVLQEAHRARCGDPGSAGKEGAAGRPSSRLGRTGHARPQLLELAVDVLIPPVNVVRAVDQRGTVRRQGGQDQRGPRPEGTHG